MVIPVAFVIVIFAALLSITAYSYHSNRRDSLALSVDLMKAIEQRITQEIQTFLTPIQNAVLLLQAVLENASFETGNPELLEPLAFRTLTSMSQISMFNLGDPHGNFFMVKKMSDGSLHTKLIDRSSKTTRVTWIRRDPSGKTLDIERTVDDSYDPRNRPWYTGAVEGRGVHWTNLYVFFTDKTYGITVSTPIIGPDDRLLCVLGLDIELKRINQFLKALRIGRSGMAVIVNEDGEVVAHPELEQMIVKEGETYRTLRIEELGDPVLQRAYNRFQVEGHGYRSLEVDDRRYLTSTFSFPTRIGRDLSVFIFVPEQDFVGFLARNNRNALLMSVGVLVLTSLMAGLMVYQGLRADRSAQTVLARQNELESQSNAFTELSSQAALFDPSDPESLSRLTEIVATSIRVRRTSVWLFDAEAGLLQCLDCYDSESGDHTQGTQLTRTDSRQLFDVLSGSADIRAPRAADDSRLRELYHIYLRPLGCESLLGMPIRHRDVTSGWLWFEHDRLSRDWSSEEISFARAIANMLALRFASEPVDVSFCPAQEKVLETENPAASTDGEAIGAAGGDGRRQKSAAAKTSRAFAADASAAVSDRTAPAAMRMPRARIDPEGIGADFFEDTTVLLLRFTDPVFLAKRWPDNSVNAFDHLVIQMEKMARSTGIEHVQVMGDEIVCAAGIGSQNRDHCRQIAELALRAQDHCTRMFEHLSLPMEFRIGVDTGAILASPLGGSRQSYNIWGEAVRFASMMARTGTPGAIQVSEGTYRCIRHGFLFRARGKFYLPGIGEVSTYFLTGRL